MNLLEKLITQAPDKPQPWFEPEMPPEPNLPKPATHLDWGFSKDQQTQAENWSDDPAFELHDSGFAPYVEAYQNYWKARAEWDQEYAKQKYVQWPLAWAMEVYNNVAVGQNTNNQASHAAAWAAESGIRLAPFIAMVEAVSKEKWE